MDPRPSEPPFAPAVSAWFRETFPGPTRAQALAWPAIASGESALVFAPTGSGKTLAAFLAAIDRLAFAPVPPKLERCRVVYVSPLKALAVDVERNLRVPLDGIARVAARRGEAPHQPLVAIRTGDTPADERARMLRQPPDILITTPESLFLLLTSRARAFLAPVETVIVDEIHAVVGTKRGAHLALSLERLQEVARRPLQRVGLSATQRPLEEVARFLGGGEGVRRWTPRPVTIVDAGAKKAFDLRVEVPVEDMARLGAPAAGVVDGREPASGAADAAAEERSIWPAMHPRLLELVRAHRSTILFVNARRLAERLATALNDLAGEPLARAHHGSIAREERLLIENALKAGELKAIVATSTLELGIDMGAVDLVIQIETPVSVASGMQRIGRASHQVEAVSRGVLFPKFRGDLLATAAVTRAMKRAAVEETRVPRNPLDVLAQQLAAAATSGEREVDELFALVRRAAPYAGLSRAAFEGVLDMLAGRYPADEFSGLRPRIVWDRRRGLIRAREGTQQVVVANAGTIPDRGLYGVFLASGAGAARRVGELDEEMVFESREGDVFVLGASSWRIVAITHDRVLVEPAPGEPGEMPFWKADRGSRPVELGRAIGALTRELAALPREAALERLAREHDFDPSAARNLWQYLEDQRQATGSLPDDRTLVLERTRDEMGDWRLVLLSPWGGRVHAPWTIALAAWLRERGELELESVWSDDGIVLRMPERERPPEAAELLPDPEAIEELVVRELPATSLYAAHFREAAARALLLPRRRPGQRSPLWMQRKRAHELLQIAARYPSFPIVLEAARECLNDVFDLPALVELARRVARREIRLVTVDTQAPSPFAASLLFGYVANYLYDGDAPLAEKRAQALTVDPAQLRELVGGAELRELVDREALATLELKLQGLEPGRLATSPDRLHDLLLRLGDLSQDELLARAVAPDGRSAAPVLDAWLDELVRDTRAIVVEVAGERRYAAAEDAGRLRDALGVALPAGLPASLLEPRPNALVDLVARYARTHGPFHPGDVVRRLGAAEAAVEAALQTLAREGRVLQGQFRPGAHGVEWCGADVMSTLRRLSLAALRRQVEPVEPDALARLLVDWHGAAAEPASRRGGPDALLDVVEQLQGLALPASILERDVLRARLPGYRPEDLDTLVAAGEVVLVGLGRIGERDGRLALFLADALPQLLPARPEPPPGDLHDQVRRHLAAHGASFFAEIHAAAGSGLAEPVVEALWDLVWAGEVTTDTPGALRAFLAARSSRAERRPRAASFRSRRQVPASAVGRFSRLALPRTAPSPTERLKAIAEQLLRRHGVLTRDAVAFEAVPGGFPAVYPVLRAFEEAGRIRRGYFVAGQGGLQFALPGALERLRSWREPGSGGEGGASRDVPQAVVLAAADPANPYGAALQWPKPGEPASGEEATGARLARAAGAHVVLVDGRLAAIVSQRGRQVVPLLPAEEPARARAAAAAAGALARWCEATARPALGWAVDGGPALADGPLAPHLAAAGFVRSGPGFRWGLAASRTDVDEEE
jgi:ATP-dependent Lhr-like helicase